MAGNLYRGWDCNYIHANTWQARHGMKLKFHTSNSQQQRELVCYIDQVERSLLTCSEMLLWCRTTWIPVIVFWILDQEWLYQHMGSPPFGPNICFTPISSNPLQPPWVRIMLCFYLLTHFKWLLLNRMCPSTSSPQHPHNLKMVFLSKVTYFLFTNLCS
jgi:hypothetical protein